MSWKIIIEPVRNDYVLTYEADKDFVTGVYSKEKDDLECTRDLLNDILFLIGKEGSKHDKRRIFVEIKE